MAMNKQEIQVWQSRIGRAGDLQSERHREWKEAIKLYTGTFFGSPLTNNSEISEVNFVYEFMKILVGSVYSRNPYIFCRARSTKRTAFAETMETVINYYWREKRVKQKMKSCVMDAVLTPPGWIEIGYFLFTMKKKLMRELESEFPELKDTGTSDKTEEEQGIQDETIKDDDVFLSHISSWRVLFPDGYHDPRMAPYLFKEQTLPLIDILNNPAFKNTKYELRKHPPRMNTRQKADLKTMKSVPPVVGGITHDTDLETIPIILYHCFDRRTRKRFVLAKNFNEGTLYEGEWDYPIDGFTLYPLIFNEIPATNEKSNAYPLSDIVPMFPQLKELSLISSAMNRHRKRSGTLIVTKEGILTATQKSNVQNSADLSLVELPDISESAMRGFTPPALPQDFYNLRQIYLQDLMRISGFQQLLYNVKGIETATESENVRMGAQIRQSEKVDIIEDFTVDIARGLSGLIWYFIQDKNRIAKIIGEEQVTEEMWPTLPEDINEARKIIQQELEFRIEAGSTRPPKDKAVEQKLFIQAIDMVEARFPGTLSKAEAVKELMKEFDRKDLEKLVRGFEDEEIRAAQQENALLMKGMPQVVTPNENHEIHLKVHSTVYNTPGLQSTPEMDEHIMQHNNYYMQQTPGAKQASSAGKANAKGGVPTMSDLVSGATAMRGVGGEKGGMIGGR